MPYRFGCIWNCRIEHLVQVAATCLPEQNWLFVNIDSSFGENLAAGKDRYCNWLSSHGIRFWWRPEGLWIPGDCLPSLVEKRSFIVPYSAAYIFPATIVSAEPPRYTSTSEMDDFSQGLPSLLREEIERLGATGYVADGDGLNYVFRGDWADRIIDELSDGAEGEAT